MLPVRFLAAADLEGYEAIEWYEERERGLGIRFRESVERTIGLARNDPFLYQVAEPTYLRRAPVGDFPYILVYSVRDDELLIVAIFHTSRDPLIWQGRID